jgi:dephospho-CoA kinase
VGLVWVTGNSGTGKSTVRIELARRGRLSFDTDEDGMTVWRHRSTGVEVDYPGGGNHPENWLEEHGWIIDRPRVERLAELAREQTVFLCGSVENEDEVWDLFDTVVCLVLDESTLRERIAARTTNEFGKRPEELEAILKWNPTMETSYRGLGALVVDANQPLADIVDQILAPLPDS